jgi:hypothetical protein
MIVFWIGYRNLAHPRKRFLCPGGPCVPGRDHPPRQCYSINGFTFLLSQTSNRLPYRILQIIQGKNGFVKGRLISHMLIESWRVTRGRGNAGYYFILISGGIPFSNNAGYDMPSTVQDQQESCLQVTETDTTPYDWMKSKAGRLGMRSILEEIRKLNFIREVHIEPDICFHGISQDILRYFKERARPENGY